MLNIMPEENVRIECQTECQNRRSENICHYILPDEMSETMKNVTVQITRSKVFFLKINRFWYHFQTNTKYEAPLLQVPRHLYSSSWPSITICSTSELWLKECSLPWRHGTLLLAGWYAEQLRSPWRIPASRWRLGQSPVMPVSHTIFHWESSMLWCNSTNGGWPVVMST